jgi:hypothetical protein
MSITSMLKSHDAVVDAVPVAVDVVPVVVDAVAVAVGAGIDAEDVVGDDWTGMAVSCARECQER